MIRRGLMMKVLVAYYSWSGTTKRLAKEIMKRLPDADEFEIKVSPQTFSSDMWRTDSIYLKQRHTGKLPAINELPSNLDDYSLILVGSPVWHWGVSSPVMQFLKQIQGYQGKIAPFYTSTGNSERYMEYFNRAAGKLRVTNDFDAEYDNDLGAWLAKLTV